jgi:hypothetical protein
MTVLRLNGSSRMSAIVIRRFEEIIGGRVYHIEAARVHDNRWRAQIVRIPGVPTALMPFYGATPDEAAGNLREWLARAHRAITGGV